MVFGPVPLLTDQKVNRFFVKRRVKLTIFPTSGPDLRLSETTECLDDFETTLSFQQIISYWSKLCTWLVQSVYMQRTIQKYNKDVFVNHYASAFDVITMKQKQKYREMFETQKSRNKTSSGDIGLNVRTLASPKVGQNQVSGGVSVLCWHAAPVANVLWKPLAIR